jgi:Ran GTPase-activating protein (RanGAP) involved in mRNA processing and transport
LPFKQSALNKMLRLEAGCAEDITTPVPNLLSSEKIQSLISRIRQNDPRLTAISPEQTGINTYELEELRTVFTEINKLSSSHVNLVDLRDSYWSLSSNFTMRDPSPFVGAAAEFIRENKTVKSLYLQNCSIGNHVVKITRAIEENSTLTLLDLTGNLPDVDNREAAFAAIAEMLKINKSLEVIKLGRYRINEAAITLFADSMSRNIREIDLSTNDFGNSESKAFEVLGDVLRKSPKLEVLHLNFVNVLNDTFISLVKGLEESLTLRKLNVSFMHLSRRERWNYLFKALTKNTSIEELNMWNTQLAADAGSHIQEMLVENKTLRCLNFRFIDMTKEQLSHVFMGLKHNRSLETINLSGLDVQHMDWFEAFRSFLESNTPLKNLHFAGKRFAVVSLSGFCASLALNYSLSFLDLSNCFPESENILQLLYSALKDNNSLSVLLLHNNTFIPKDLYQGLTPLVEQNKSLTCLGFKGAKPIGDILAAVGLGIKGNSSLVHVSFDFDYRWKWDIEASKVLSKTEENKFALSQNTKLALFAKVQSFALDHQWVVPTILSMFGSCFRLPV